MSIPLDRLYHYIESVAQEVYGDTVIYHFYPHGSKKIDDLIPYPTYPEIIRASVPEIVCNDQEPLNFDLYKDSFTTIPEPPAEIANHDDATHLKLNLRRFCINVYDKCVLLHSEMNSIEEEKYKNNGFSTAYYWSHALLSLDWYRYARYISLDLTTFDQMFLIYNRAWTGTREYRLKFAELLAKNSLENACKTSVGFIDDNKHYTSHQFKNPVWVPDIQLENYFNRNQTTSTSSADFDLLDYQSTLIEVVLETLFDDTRWHLTEKTLRPIALGKPFILCSTPGSLQYLKQYGFKTFNEVFDESYDLISDPVERLHSIINLLKEISSWSGEYLNKKVLLLKEIVRYNKLRFFSDDFFVLIEQELKNNLGSAIAEVVEKNTYQRSFDLVNALSKNKKFLEWQYPLLNDVHGFETIWATIHNLYNKHHNK